MLQAQKVSELGVYKGYQTKDYKGYQHQSQYVAMPDGVRLATDIFLPKKRKAGEKFPTIIYFVRYVRSVELKNFYKILGHPRLAHVPKKEIDFFTSNGYACAIVDLRGSGASFGSRKMEFSDEEVMDMTTIMDWIIGQDWSDKKLATTGISYTGTTAELALSSKHPALKACIARCNIFDLYDDMNFPGGVRQAPFIEVWKKTTQALDLNNFKIFGGLIETVVKGINPVDGDKKGILLKQAIEEHKANFDIFSGIYRVENRDDIEPKTGQSSDDFSIHNRIQAITESEVPIYRISGWYDGANVHAAIKGFMNISNTKKLLIGPWDHGPDENISPFAKNNKVHFKVYEEMLRFFDFYVKGIDNGIDVEAPVHYYQMGKEQFIAEKNWPVPGAVTETFYVSDQNTLHTANTEEGEAVYDCDYTVGSTGQARWNSLTGLYRNGEIDYKDRQGINKRMLLFTSPRTKKTKNITGHPVVDFYISIDTTDTYLFVYLEDVDPTGKVTYITEGQFRAIHRKITDETKAPYKHVVPYHTYHKADRQPLVKGEVARISFGLQPTSYLLQKGHQLQISVAVSDVDHFDLLNEKPTKLKVHYSEKYPSQVILPVVLE
jgi:putative CocE/NonD family hydrolase